MQAPQTSITLITSKSCTMQTYFISINNNAPRVKHGENQKPSCYVNITSFRMMADITLIVIPDATSAARLLCNP